METKEIKIGGMHCLGCVRTLTQMLSQIPGVQKVDISFEKKLATINYDEAVTDTSRFNTVIDNAGFDLL